MRNRDAGDEPLLRPGERARDVVAQLAVGEAEEGGLQREVRPPLR
ncbi:hypothetical protein [Pseudonocardia sp. TRM90224]|nr:hypothetical protein [Pseudonocardia sp. TRM90224]